MQVFSKGFHFKDITNYALLNICKYMYLYYNKLNKKLKTEIQKRHIPERVRYTITT